MKPKRLDKQNRSLCTARKKNGQLCDAPAIRGGSVCRKHGGSAPQVKKAAALRLAELVDPAIGVVARSMKDYRKDPPTALRAAFGALDRNGYGPTQEVRLGGMGPDGIIETANVSARELLRRRIASLTSEPSEDS